MRTHCVYEPCINIMDKSRTSLGNFEEWLTAVDILERILEERYPGAWVMGVGHQDSTCQYVFRDPKPYGRAVIGLIDIHEVPVHLLRDLWWTFRTWISQKLKVMSR